MKTAVDSIQESQPSPPPFALFQLGIALSAGFWVLGFSLFVWVYLPIFIRPRVDGKLG